MYVLEVVQGRLDDRLQSATISTLLCSVLLVESPPCSLTCDSGYTVSLVAFEKVSRGIHTSLYAKNRKPKAFLEVDQDIYDNPRGTTSPRLDSRMACTLEHTYTSSSCPTSRKQKLKNNTLTFSRTSQLSYIHTTK